MDHARQAELASDLAYVKTLAEEGAHAPLVGGRHYVIWGGLMAAASFIVYLNVLGVLGWGRAGALAPWAVAGVIGWASSLTVGRRAAGKPGAATIGNKTAFAVWFAVGIMMTVMVFAMIFAQGRYTDIGVPPYFLYSMMYPIGFGVYGVAFYATATAARATWLKGFAALSWAFAAISLFLLASEHQFLFGGAGMLLCAFLPGVLLMRKEPADII